MRNLISIACIATCAMTWGGCHDNTPPPPRVPVPAQHSTDREDGISMREREDAGPGSPAPSTPAAPMADDRVARGNTRQYSDRDEIKPLSPPAQAEDPMRPPFDDEPVISQRPPEERAFVEAYRRVGSPRLTLFVNRNRQGDPVASNEDPSMGSAEPMRSLDYQAIETIMTDWLASGGQVTVVSPTTARQQQLVDADIVIHVQAHPTRQVRDAGGTGAGAGVRVVAEAVNSKGGESLGRAVVDVPPPLEKTTINRYTRFLARKLMDDMTQTWMSPPPAAGAAGQQGAPRDEQGGAIPERSVVTPPPAPAQQPQLPPATQPTDPR